MELPNDVWDIIVKKSLKTDEEIIKDKTYYQLSHLMSEIKFRQNQIIRWRTCRQPAVQQFR